MLTRRHRTLAAVVVALMAGAARTHARASERRAEYQDAFVAFDSALGEWTIGNAQIDYSIQVRRDGSVALAGLVRAGSTEPATVSLASDALATFGGQTIHLGEAETDFVVDGVAPSVGGHFVALSIRFRSTARQLIATRHYLVYPLAPAVEMWTTFEGVDEVMRTVENLNAYSIDIRAGAIDWVSGLDTPQADGGPFTHRTRDLASGERLTLGSPVVSSEIESPYFSVGNGQERVVSGLLWSGGWSLSFERQADALHVEFGLPPMSAWTRSAQIVEGPHAFVGAVLDQPGAATAAVTAFVRAGRVGRSLPALTTFNTWFVHGIEIDEATIRRDIDLAAEVGLEQFQLDAGWYPREGPTSAFDFSNGLGNWEADRDRFPSGLGALTDYAHERGLRFGIWVEPERIWIDTVGRPGLAQESYLAQQDGAYSPGTPNAAARDAQVCLADPAARAWVLERLTRFIDEVRPDNLKWDVNRWIACTRPGHGHPTDGGNYAHTQALYEILATLRQRYPALTIENCAGGGHRLDFALARLTDSAWMDDRTAPAAHVRRNLQGLLSLFPAEYLFSYVMPHPDEPIRGGEDIPFLVRSRMPGMVGLAAELGELGEREKNELYQQFTLVRSLREAQGRATTYPLTPQRPGPGEWEVVQQVMPDTGISYIFAFSAGAPDSTVVSLRAIQPDRVYEMRSADRGTIGQLLGADLLTRGLELTRAPESAAQVLVLEPIASADPRRGTSAARQTPAGRQPVRRTSPASPRR
jgi:alpha-galactosidase